MAPGDGGAFEGEGEGEELDPGLEGYSDSGSDFHDFPEPDLPIGIKKTLISPSLDKLLKRPEAGDEVAVHVAAARARDGAGLRSSRDPPGGEPVRFVLGQGEVMRGLDAGVATMRRGEVAAFTIPPRFTQGGLGFEPSASSPAPVLSSPPLASSADDKAEERAEALVLEVELVDWLPRSDLFEDGSVVKRVLRRPDDKRRPIVGQECLVSCQLAAVGRAGGDALMENPDLRYRIRGLGFVGGDDTISSSAAAPISGALLDRALLSMKRGEVAALECSARVAFGVALPAAVDADTPVRCRLELREFLEESDVSFERNGVLRKRSLQCRDAWVKCRDAGRCRLSVSSAQYSSGAEVTVDQAFDFVVGNGDVCDALECIAISMREGEVASVRCSAPGRYFDEPLLGRLAEAEAEAEPRRGRLAEAGASLELHARLESYMPGPLEAARGDAERLEALAERKEGVVALFKAGRLELAAFRFRCIYEALGYIDDYRGVRGGEERKRRVGELKRSCLLNRALCLLKAGLFKPALGSCDLVLSEEPNSAKALFRRAQAHLGLGNGLEALRDARAAAALEPASKEARGLLGEVREKLKQDGEHTQPLYAKMCGGLGSLPHPLDVD